MSLPFGCVRHNIRVIKPNKNKNSKIEICFKNIIMPSILKPIQIDNRLVFDLTTVNPTEVDPEYLDYFT